MAFVKRNVREGLLGRMLKELLDTRIMIKQVGVFCTSRDFTDAKCLQAMKSSKGDKVGQMLCM